MPPKREQLKVEAPKVKRKIDPPLVTEKALQIATERLENIEELKR